MRRKWIWIALALIAAAYAAFNLTPWPSVALFRFGFTRDTERRLSALAKHVPDNVAHVWGERYGSGSDAGDVLNQIIVQAPSNRLTRSC